MSEVDTAEVVAWVFGFQDLCLATNDAFATILDTASAEAHLRRLERVQEAYGQGQKIGLSGGGAGHEPYHGGERRLAWLAGWLVGNFRFVGGLASGRKPAIGEWVIYPWEELPWNTQFAYNRRAARAEQEASHV